MTIIAWWFVALNGYAEEHHSRMDSIQHVQEVVIMSRPTYREVIPSQQLNGKELERLSSLSVADALRYFAGLQIKDYGGVGGIKTVNIRSMGSNHLGIYYDGIELGNAQNGQIDLGQFSLDNVEEITLYNGQKSAIFQPASDFAHAGSVYIRTKTPRFTVRKPYNLIARAKYGSSDMLQLSGLYEYRISPELSASVSLGGLSSSGKYHFRYRRLNADHTVAYDTTAVRQNGDIWAVRAEGNLYGLFNHGSWNAKLYTYHSERGIPGAIVNNVWRRGERQADHNTFAQALIQKSIGDRFSTQWLMKYAYYQTHYANHDSTTLSIDNTYKQQEFYLSSANVYEILPHWSASLSYDFKYNTLTADMINFARPSRYTHLASVATAIDWKILKLQGSVLTGWFIDHTAGRDAASTARKHTMTPSVFVNVYPFREKIFSVRAFAKRSFRMPTFNDLYYTEIGNANLKPEVALQYDAGFLLNKQWNQGLLRGISVQADAYYNTIHDKIIAYPKGQQFRWTMLNLGKVHIKGVDAQVVGLFQPAKDLTVNARLQYTYQQARNVTDPSDSYYNDQIPYIPWNSGSAIINMTYRQWNINYSFIYVGERYNEPENIVYNYMQPWYTSDISISRVINWQKIHWTIQLEINNLLSQDYDVIINYPMPKRNYGLTIKMEL
jgi:vitamin B12 transporter